LALGASRLNGVASILGLNQVNPRSGAGPVNPQCLHDMGVDPLIAGRVPSGPKRLKALDNL
jgi:hypothetical protein